MAETVGGESELALFLEASDVARELGLSYSGIYAMVQSGTLKPVALTKRGIRLFSEEDVAILKALREARQEERQVARPGA